MLAVAGGKGGCGKTTTTACLARALAARADCSNSVEERQLSPLASEDRKPPLAVDADRDMPDLHVVAGTSGRPGIGDYGDGASLSEVAYEAPALPGVRVVPSVGTDPAALSAGLDRLRSLDRPVVVDTPAGASPGVADPLRAADAVLLVTTPDRESLEDAAKTAAMARALETPVVGSVVVRSNGDVDPQPLLSCPTLAHVPSVRTPLDDPGVRDAAAALADAVAAFALPETAVDSCERSGKRNA